MSRRHLIFLIYLMFSHFQTFRKEKYHYYFFSVLIFGILWFVLVMLVETSQKILADFQNTLLYKQ